MYLPRRDSSRQLRPEKNQYFNVKPFERGKIAEKGHFVIINRDEMRE
jgi:hypothetical protein